MKALLVLAAIVTVVDAGPATARIAPTAAFARADADRAIDIDAFRAADAERLASADQNRDGGIDRDQSAAFISGLGLGGA